MFCIFILHGAQNLDLNVFATITLFFIILFIFLYVLICPHEKREREKEGFDSVTSASQDMVSNFD
jgi:uncharacterized membrane protein YjfL (UPF0719 family)